jgi:hypothetical protein
VLAILQSGFRDITQLPEENDTPVYQYVYEEIQKTSWSSILSSFSFYSSSYEERDGGYPILIKITQLFCSDFTVFMLLTATIFFIPFGCLVYKYVNSIWGIVLSFLIYFAIFSNIANSFMRQSITLGIVLIALRYIVRREWKKYFGILLAAFTIHTSAVIAFPFYFLPRFAKSRKWLLAVLAVSPILVIYVNVMLNYFLSGSVYENYSSDDVVNPMNYMLLLIAISVLSYVFYSEICLIDDFEILISGVIGAMFLLPIVSFGGTMLRISYYYAIMLVPLIPVIIDNMKISEYLKYFVYIFSILFFLFIILR